MVPNEDPARKRHMSERKKRSNDAAATKTEFEKASANCIEFHVKWKWSCTKNELDIEPNEKKIDTHQHLWGINMKVLWII